MSTEMTEFVLHGARTITPAFAEVFRQDLPDLKLKLTAIQGEGVESLPGRVEFLIELFEDVLDGVYNELSYQAFGEMVFAMAYVHKGVDIIPDSVPGIGYQDDAAVVACVFARNEEELATFARSEGIDWDALK